jgi:putative transposase
MRTQCKLLGIARSSVGYVPVPECDEDARLKRLLDELYLRDPCLGTRRLVSVLLRDHGLAVNRKRLQRLRRAMGVEAIYCKPRTSIPEKTHRIYPYLLRELNVTRPDQVWCADITYVPMPRGHAYLCAVMDWHPLRAGLGREQHHGRVAVPVGTGSSPRPRWLCARDLQHRSRQPVHE